jgi:hypothetical protein
MGRVPRFLRRLASAALVLALAWSPALAQTHRASIRGTVLDPAGKRLPGVAIHVINEQTRESRHVKTDHEGRFTIAEIPPGTYRLTIDHAGYGRYIARAELAMNQDYWLNIGLQSGDAIQAIDVVSPFLPSDHETPALHAFITDRDLNEWPNESGRQLELALLAPQTAPPPQGSPTARHGRFAMNVLGARDDSNAFVLDGVYNVDPSFNTPVVQPPIDAVRQFQVFTSNYDASFGRGAGAQISVVTKSGTNAFSGSGYELLRGTALGGRNHFAPKEGPAPQYERNQAGGTIGGPIVRNHAFFFADYEHLYLREAIPLASDPRAAGSVAAPVSRDDSDRADARLDHALGEGARLTARYSFGDRRLFEPSYGTTATATGVDTSVPVRAHHASITVTDARSSVLVNDFRVGYNRVLQHTSGGNAPPQVTPFAPLVEQAEPLESSVDALQIADTVTFSHGHHSVRIGGEWHAIQGNFTRNVAAGGRRELETSTTSAFVQNDWRPASTLTLSAGLRYEYATPPIEADNRVTLYDPATGALVRAGTGGVPRGGYVADANNIAPRAGFAWTVGSDRMNVIRGGYGAYYTQPGLAASGLLLATEPGNFSPDDVSGLGPVLLPPSATGYQHDLQTPRLDTWSVSLQHQLGQSRAFEFAYAGSRGRHLLAARDINQPPASPTVPNPRPNPRFADIAMLESRATSRYDGFHIRFQQRPATGTSMFLQYTFGKTTDDESGLLPTTGDPNFPQNSLDVLAERGRASFDIRHRFSGAITRPLPFNAGQSLGHLGILSRALADTDLEASATIEGGRPFTVAILPGIDVSNTGSSRFGFGTNDRPNVSGNAALAHGTESQWFKTSAFSVPAFGSFGNTGRNTLTGPGFKSINAAIVKHIRLGTHDRARIDLRLEAFNLLSTVNFDLPNAFLGSVWFGHILSAGSPRRVQFGVRATF